MNPRNAIIRSSLNRLLSDTCGRKNFWGCHNLLRKIKGDRLFYWGKKRDRGSFLDGVNSLRAATVRERLCRRRAGVVVVRVSPSAPSRSRLVRRGEIKGEGRIRCQEPILTLERLPAGFGDGQIESSGRRRPCLPRTQPRECRADDLRDK